LPSLTFFNQKSSHTKCISSKRRKTVQLKWNFKFFVFTKENTNLHFFKQCKPTDFILCECGFLSTIFNKEIIMIERVAIRFSSQMQYFARKNAKHFYMSVLWKHEVMFRSEKIHKMYVEQKVFLSYRKMEWKINNK